MFVPFFPYRPTIFKLARFASCFACSWFRSIRRRRMTDCTNTLEVLVSNTNWRKFNISSDPDCTFSLNLPKRLPGYNYFFAVVGDRFWTSGSNTIDGKTWIWLASGKVIDYTNWKSGQPDHSNERCLEVVQDKNKGLLWNNLDCDKKIDFICESYSNYPCKGNVIPSPKSNWPVPVIESNYSIG